MDCDKFETSLKYLPSGDLTIHCVFIKRKNNRPLLTIIPFKIYLDNFPIQKINFAGNLLLANRCSIFSNDKHQDYCLFLFPTHIEIRGKLKSQQRTKRAEKLHKDAQPVIVPTDAFKLQISAQNKAPRLVCW